MTKSEKTPKKVKVVEVALTRRISLTEKICPQCDKRFMGMRIQRYCSKRCSNLAAYWRNPETYRQNRLDSYRRRRDAETA